MLNIKQSTNKLAIVSELGCLPMCIERKIRIGKYWLKLYSNKIGNIIIRVIYNQTVDDMDKGDTNWAFKVIRLLESICFPEVWMFPGSVVINSFIPMLQKRLTDAYITNWREGMETCSSLSLLRHVKQIYEPAPYLTKVLNKKSKHNIQTQTIIASSFN